MKKNIVKNLEKMENVSLHAPLSEHEIKQKINSFIALPKSHIEFLKKTDGLECYGGYFRLLGLDDRKENIKSWNQQTRWKFSWESCNYLDNFICFGETAWGDQYAYKVDKYQNIINTDIYFLDFLTMQPEIIANEFELFLVDEIARNASKPYDEILVDVRNRIGDLSINEHITYVPSLLIDGVENSKNVQKINSVDSMIFNGDLHSQLSEELQDRNIKKINVYKDNLGRMRLKVYW